MKKSLFRKIGNETFIFRLPKRLQKDYHKKIAWKAHSSSSSSKKSVWEIMSQLNVYCKCETNKLTKVPTTLLILFHLFLALTSNSIILRKNKRRWRGKKENRYKRFLLHVQFRSTGVEAGVLLWEYIYGLLTFPFPHFLLVSRGSWTFLFRDIILIGHFLLGIKKKVRLWTRLKTWRVNFAALSNNSIALSAIFS